MRGEVLANTVDVKAGCDNVVVVKQKDVLGLRRVNRSVASDLPETNPLHNHSLFCERRKSLLHNDLQFSESVSVSKAERTVY